MATPTVEQLKSYAAQLPPIYRDILVAFRDTTPDRRYGEGLALDVVAAEMTNRGLPYTMEEILAAADKLEERRFMDIGVQDFTWLSLTPLGEELLAALTGKRTPKVSVPELPQPTW